MKRALVLILGVTAVACSQPAPPPPAPPPPPPSTAIVSSLKFQYEGVKMFLTQSAAMIPEAKYAYQPTKEVRTIGQLIGHVADANFLFCGYSSGQTGPAAEREKLTKKADLQKALADSFAFCDQALAALTNDVVGGQAAELTVINNQKSTRAGAFAFNTGHDEEHYGNLVTYMRLNKMVPPSTTPPAPAK